MVKGVRVVCRHDRCALRDGVVCRKARMASPQLPPAQSAALSLLSHPPLFTFSHFRRFPSGLWRTPRTLSPCTSKYSWRVNLQYPDSRRLTQISCIPNHAGYLLNILWFRFLRVALSSAIGVVREGFGDSIKVGSDLAGKCGCLVGFVVFGTEVKDDGGCFM